MNPARAWNAFWFGPISARPLGAFRIAFGLIVLANLALLVPEFDFWLTDAGPLSSSAARALATSQRPSILHWIGDPSLVRVLFAGIVVVDVLFTLGWQTRSMGVLLYVGLLSIHHRIIPGATGADSLIVFMAFYLMISPAGAAYSFDARREARRRGGAPAEPIIVPWAQRLIQIQVSLIYFLTALYKASGETWLDGTALHYVLGHGGYRRFHLGLRDAPLAINAMTHAGLLAEFALASLLWVRAARPWVMLAGVLLHGGILLMLNVPIFGELMIATYLTFLTPGELDALLGWVNPRRRGRRPIIPTLPEPAST